MSTYDVIPEARYGVDFNDVWSAFNRCSEYCGTRRALHLVLDHMGRLAWNTVFQTLEDEAAGEWAWQAERDEEEWPPDEPRGKTRPTVGKIERELAIAAISGARAAMRKVEAGEEPDDEESDEEGEE